MIAEFGGLAQAAPSHSGEVDGGGQGVEGFVGADVGGGAFAADVLFAGLEGQDISGAAGGVGGAPHESAGHLADVLLLAAEQAEVGAAKGWRDAQGLAFAGDDVGAEMAGGAQHSHSEGVGGDDEEGAVGVGGGCQVVQVVEGAVEVGVLGDDAGGGLSDGAGGGGGGEGVNGDALGLAVGGDDLSVGRGDGVAEDDLLAAGDAAGHQDGFGQAGGAVVHSGVGDVHSVEGADHRLEFEDDLEGALGDFGLVRGVGGEELAAGHEGLDGGRHKMVVGAGAEEGGAAGQGAVAGCQIAEFALDVQFGHWGWQA